jgi:hypothetical protein
MVDTMVDITCKSKWLHLKPGAERKWVPQSHPRARPQWPKDLLLGPISCMFCILSIVPPCKPSLLPQAPGGILKPHPNCKGWQHPSFLFIYSQNNCYGVRFSLKRWILPLLDFEWSVDLRDPSLYMLNRKLLKYTEGQGSPCGRQLIDICGPGMLLI